MDHSPSTRGKKKKADKVPDLKRICNCNSLLPDTNIYKDDKIVDLEKTVQFSTIPLKHLWASACQRQVKRELGDLNLLLLV